MKPKWLIILTLVVTLLGMTAPTYAGDMVYISAFKIYADKSTLVIELKKYQNQFAAKLTISAGQGQFYITGIVYKEKVNADNSGKIEAAVVKLSEILNDPKRRIFVTEKDFSSDIGLTFEKYVGADNLSD